MVLYKKAKTILAPLLARLFSAIGALDKTPPGFLDGIIRPIYKSGDRTLPLNYRPITLLGTDYRLLASILGNRLMPHLDTIIDPAQTAFIRESGCTPCEQGDAPETHHEGLGGWSSNGQQYSTP